MFHASTRRNVARARKRWLRLQLEALEPRHTPAVVGVDALANVHAIDPNIYGSAFASTSQIADLHLPINRNGGNASDTYSFVQDATNHGSDWFFESIAAGSGNGQGIDSFINATKAGGGDASITLNLFDWAAKLGNNRSNLGSFAVSKYGPQQSVDPWATNWGNGVLTNGTPITGNDPNDAYIANRPTIEQAWIQHLIATFGDSQHGGVKYYTLGNEPGLWNSTHRDIHPNGDTLPELRDRIIAYASMVKALDPGAKILGPEEWGWTNYFISGADAAAQNWGATYNGLNAEAWLLDQLRQHDAATGQRLLDYFTLHFYPQGGQFSNDVSTNMELLRNRSTRSLWDPNYVDESWIGGTGINGGKVNLINLMKNWVNQYYAGTKIGLTEYNWGAEGDMNGATTQADIWGIFGREGLDLANRWTTPATGTPTYLAMKMFRNYDGNGSAFGNTSVGASVANPDQVDAFASTRSADGALTVLVINKNLFDPNNPSANTPITINLSNFSGSGTAQEWELAAVNPSDQTNAAISHLSDIHFAGNSFTVSVPMESVTMFVIMPASSSAPATPTGVAASAGDARVTLSWNASAGAAGYKIYRGTTTGPETLLQAGVTGTTFTDTGLTNGTTYFYQVSAYNAGGESARSIEVSAKPQAAPTTQLLNDGQLQQYNRTTQTWSTIDRNVAAFQVDSTGLLYDLENGGNLWSYSSGTWALIDRGVATIKLAPDNRLWDLETNGQLWTLSGGSWAKPDTGVSQIDLDGNGVLYDLESRGDLWQRSASSTKIDTLVSSFHVGSSGVLAYQKQNGSVVAPSFAVAIPGSGFASYGVDASGNVWLLNGSNLQELGSGGLLNTIAGVSSFAVTADGTRVIYLQGTSVYTLPVGAAATLLNASATQFSLANDGTVYVQTSTGQLLRFAAGSTQSNSADANSVTSFVIAANGDVYAIETSNALVALNTDGRKQLDAMTASIAVSLNGTLYERETTGALWSLVAGGVNGAWNQLDAGTRSFVVSPSGALYDLEANRQLWLLDGTTWTQLDPGVSFIAMADDGTLVDLETNGSLWRLNSAGWFRLAMGASAPSMANGYQVSFTQAGVVQRMGV